MREHTPGPWAIRIKEEEATIYNSDAGSIARVPRELCPKRGMPWEANAAFIVKACNGYEDLRGLLEDLWDKTSDYLFVNSGDYYEYKARIEAIRKAAR